MPDYHVHTEKKRFAFVIPVFNHEARVGDVARAAMKLSIPVIVVDDGSTDGTYNAIRDIKGITVLRHAENRGKGAALKTGMAEAALIADWVITIDADGQHDPAEASSLIGALSGKERAIVIGVRQDMAGPDVPWTSSFGRKFSNFWVWCSGGKWLQDTQSGFRIYPVPETLYLRVRADRFQFEVEVLARAGWKGIPVIEAPVSVSYNPGTGRISHFRPFIDFMRNSSTFMSLIFQRILVPGFIRKKW